MKVLDWSKRELDQSGLFHKIIKAYKIFVKVTRALQFEIEWNELGHLVPK